MLCMNFYMSVKKIFCPCCLHLKNECCIGSCFPAILIWEKVCSTQLTMLFSQVLQCFPDIAPSVLVLFSNLRMLFSQKICRFPRADFVEALIFLKTQTLLCWTPSLLLKSISLSAVFKRNKVSHAFLKSFLYMKKYWKLLLLDCTVAKSKRHI